MPKMPFYLVFLQSLPETAIIVSLGLVLIGIKLEWKKIIIISLITSVASYLIRLIPIPPGTNILIQLPVMVLLIAVVYNLSVKYASLASFIGLIVVFISELILNEVIAEITGISVSKALTDPVLRVVFPIPEFIFLAIMVQILRKKEITLFNTKELLRISRLNINKDRSLLPTLSILGLGIVLTVVGMYNQTYLYGVIDYLGPTRVVISVNVVIIVSTLASVIIIRTFYLAAKHEDFLKVQELHIGQLKELIKVIRVQRHDFVNHLQSVYALLKIGQVQKAQNYIEDLYNDVKLTSEMLRLNCPELAALLLVKSGVADQQGISFIIEVESSLDKVKIKALDINTFVGNLLDNAFEAVITLSNEKKEVKFRLFETPSRYVFQTINQGFISKDVLNKIFIPEFSTKLGGRNRGLGLSSVKSVVEKNKGKIIVTSDYNRGVVFTVFFLKR